MFKFNICYNTYIRKGYDVLKEPVIKIVKEGVNPLCEASLSGGSMGKLKIENRKWKLENFSSLRERLECLMSVSEQIAFLVRVHPVGEKPCNELFNFSLFQLFCLSQSEVCHA